MSLCPAWGGGVRAPAQGTAQDGSRTSGPGPDRARAGAGAGAQRLTSGDPARPMGDHAHPPPQRSPCPEASMARRPAPVGRHSTDLPSLCRSAAEEESCADAQDGSWTGSGRLLPHLHHALPAQPAMRATVTLFAAGSTLLGPRAPSVPRVLAESLPAPHCPSLSLSVLSSPLCPSLSGSFSLHRKLETDWGHFRGRLKSLCAARSLHVSENSARVECWVRNEAYALTSSDGALLLPETCADTVPSQEKRQGKCLWSLLSKCRLGHQPPSEARGVYFSLSMVRSGLP